jgi:hypothetical protein
VFAVMDVRIPGNLLIGFEKVVCFMEIVVLSIS